MLLLAGIFPKIQQAFPDATLVIFADLSGKKKLLSENGYLQLNEFVKNNPNVKHYDFSDRKILYDEFATCEYWIYPNFTFAETFCITAIEAQYSGCIPLTTKVAALDEIAPDKVLLSSPQTCIREIITAIETFDKIPTLMTEMAENGRKFAAQFDISKSGARFLEILENNV